jgi:hypothetical protein
MPRIRQWPRSRRRRDGKLRFCEQCLRIVTHGRRQKFCVFNFSLGGGHRRSHAFSAGAPMRNLLFFGSAGGYSPGWVHSRKQCRPVWLSALVSFVRSRPHAATPTKGRLIRCTVLGSTPKRCPPEIIRLQQVSPAVVRKNPSQNRCCDLNKISMFRFFLCQAVWLPQSTGPIGLFVQRV